MKIIIHIQYGGKNYYVKGIIKLPTKHAAVTTAYGQLQSSMPDNVNKKMPHLNNCSFDKMYVQNWVQQFCLCWEAHCH